MKCPKCNYISFDYNENCPKCRRSLTEVRAKMNLPSYCPMLLTQTEIDGQVPEPSIRIEQTDNIGIEESMDTQFSDSQDFETSFDEGVGESDLDVTLSDEADNLSLDFDEFSMDDSGTDHSEREMKTIAAESLEDELNLSFADDTAEMTADFEDVTADDSGKATLDFEDLSVDNDADTKNSEQEMKTILADSLENDLDLSFADDTGEMTADFEDVAADDSGKATLDFEDLSVDNDADTKKLEQEMETIMADSLENDPDLSFTDDTGEITADFEEIAADDSGKATLNFEDLSMDDADTEAPKTDSLELAEKEVDKITHDFENSISAEEKRKEKASPELEVLDLDLDLSNDNSS